MGGMRTEVMCGGPMDDKPRKIGGHTRLGPWMMGRVRLETMRDWSLCTVSKFEALAVSHFRR